MGCDSAKDKLGALEHMGILGDIRERLGAVDEDDDSKDDLIKSMDAQKIVSVWCGWELGDESWGNRIIDMYKTLQKEE